MTKVEEWTNKIICGDCLELMKELPDGCIDLVVTSPPYNKHSAKIKTHPSNTWKKSGISYGGFDDDLPEEKYQDIQKMVLKECLRILKSDGSIFYNHKPRIVNHKVIFPHEWLLGFNIRQMIIWDRNVGPVLDPIRFRPTVEYIFWITKERKTPKFNSMAFHYGEVWRINYDVGNSHPAPFPVKIAMRCIDATTEEGDLVLDMYAGSGTTAVACKNLGRRFIGMEINPDYCKIAEDRLRQEILL